MSASTRRKSLWPSEWVLYNASSSCIVANAWLVVNTVYGSIGTWYEVTHTSRLCMTRFWSRQRYLWYMSWSMTSGLVAGKVGGYPRLLFVYFTALLCWSPVVGIEQLLSVVGGASTILYFTCLELYLLLTSLAVYPVFKVSSVCISPCLVYSWSPTVMGVVPQSSPSSASGTALCHSGILLCGLL